MNDTVTITFLLAHGKTAKGEDRAVILPGATIWAEAQKIRFDPNLEDMGVGFLLDDPTVVALDTAWVDDYADTADPVLTATAIYYITHAERPEAVQHTLDDVKARAVHAPYYERGVQVVEWLVGYMEENVYNQDTDEDKN